MGAYSTRDDQPPAIDPVWQAHRLAWIYSQRAARAATEEDWARAGREYRYALMRADEAELLLQILPTDYVRDNEGHPARFVSQSSGWIDGVGRIVSTSLPWDTTRSELATWVEKRVIIDGQPKTIYGVESFTTELQPAGNLIGLLIERA